MAFGHGLQDTAKTAGVVVLELNISGLHPGDSIPIWVLVLSLVILVTDFRRTRPDAAPAGPGG